MRVDSENNEHEGKIKGSTPYLDSKRVSEAKMTGGPGYDSWMLLNKSLCGIIWMHWFNLWLRHILDACELEKAAMSIMDELNQWCKSEIKT